MKIFPEHHLFFMEIINGVFDGIFLLCFQNNFKLFLENVPKKILEGEFQIYYYICSV